MAEAFNQRDFIENFRRGGRRGRGRINIRNYMSFTPSSQTPQLGTRGNIGLNRIRRRTTTGEINIQGVRESGLPGRNFPGTLNQIQKFAGNRQQQGPAIDLRSLFRATSTSGEDDDNKAHQTFIPKIWTEVGTGYDKDIHTGDLIFTLDDDEITENQYKKPMRSVLNLQQMNRELFVRKRHGLELVRRYMANKKETINPSTPLREIVIDYDTLMDHFRKEKSNYIENVEFRDDEIKATRIMKKVVKDWEDARPGVINELWTLYDNYKSRTVSDLAEIFNKYLAFLSPELIRSKYQFMGVQVDSMNQVPIKMGNYTRAATSTVLVRGPEYVTNIFGEAGYPVGRVAKQFPMNGIHFNELPERSMIPSLGRGNKLHIVLMNVLPKAWQKELNRDMDVPTRSHPLSFVPTWAVPVIGPTKSHLLCDLDNESPFVESSTIKYDNPYNLGTEKSEKISTRFYYTSATSWHIGKVMDIMDSKVKPGGFYPRVWGVKNYDLSSTGLTDVYKSREVAGLVKIFIKG